MESLIMVLFSGKFSELWIDWVGVSHGYHIHDENIAKKSFLLQENNTRSRLSILIVVVARM